LSDESRWFTDVLFVHLRAGTNSTSSIDELGVNHVLMLWDYCRFVRRRRRVKKKKTDARYHVYNKRLFKRTAAENKKTLFQTIAECKTKVIRNVEVRRTLSTNSNSSELYCKHVRASDNTIRPRFTAESPDIPRTRLVYDITYLTAFHVREPRL